jgi:hypothetical protein
MSVHYRDDQGRWRIYHRPLVAYDYVRPSESFAFDLGRDFCTDAFRREFRVQPPEARTAAQRAQLEQEVP